MARRMKQATNDWSKVLGKLIKVSLVLALFVGSGWWLFFSKSDNKVRRATLDKLSIFVDRMDEVSQAWKDREPPETLTVKSETKPAKTETRTPARPAPAPEPTRAPERTTTRSAAPAPAPAPAPAKKTISKPKPAPSAGEATPEEQEQLRDLFKELNSK